VEAIIGKAGFQITNNVCLASGTRILRLALYRKIRNTNEKKEAGERRGLHNQRFRRSKSKHHSILTIMTDETKTETLKEEEQKAVAGVKDRLKFFFSDANVRQDRFIRNFLLGKDKQVPVGVLLRFNTIKKHTTSPAVVAAAAQELSDTLALNESKNAISRVTPFTAALMDENIPKSLIVQNLPMKEEDGLKRYTCTVADLRAPFAKFGEVAMVDLKFHRVDKKRQANGNAMIEFETKESLEKAAEALLTIKDGETVEAKESITIGDKQVSVMLLSEYKEMRKKEKGTSNKKHKREEKPESPEKPVKTFTIDWKPGCVIQLKGLAETCDREAILDTVAKGMNTDVAGVKEKKVYADFCRGQTDGAIRFAEATDDIAAIAKRLKDGELEIAGKKVDEAQILDGEEEKKYWENFVAFKNKQIRQNHEMKQAKKKQRTQ